MSLSGFVTFLVWTFWVSAVALPLVLIAFVVYEVNDAVKDRKMGGSDDRNG